MYAYLTNLSIPSEGMASRPVANTYLFIYSVIFTQEYPISAQHCSPWGSCITCMTKQTSISIEFVVIPQIVTEHNHLVNIIFTWWLTFEKDYESLGNTHKL